MSLKSLLVGDKPRLVVLSTIFSVLLAIFLTEIILPIFSDKYKATPKVKYYTIEDGARIGKKNTKAIQYNTANEFRIEVSFNDHGFRDEKDLRDSKEEDIFIVGDSMGMGHGVDEDKRFSNILDKILAKKNVYNISIPTNIPGYVANTKYAISRGANIKNVIVGVTMENDIYLHSDNRKLWKQSKKGQRDYLGRIKHFLVDNSVTYRLITSIIHQNKIIRNFFLSIGIIKPPLYVDSYTGISHDFLNKAVDSSVKELEYFKKFNTVILINPSRYLWVKETKNKAEHKHNQFVKKLKENKYFIIDLKELFINYENPINELHFPIDGHLNIFANKVVGEYIFNELQKENIFDLN